MQPISGIQPQSLEPKRENERPSRLVRVCSKQLGSGSTSRTPSPVTESDACGGGHHCHVLAKAGCAPPPHVAAPAVPCGATITSPPVSCREEHREQSYPDLREALPTVQAGHPPIPGTAQTVKWSSDTIAQLWKPSSSVIGPDADRKVFDKKSGILFDCLGAGFVALFCRNKSGSFGSDKARAVKGRIVRGLSARSLHIGHRPAFIGTSQLRSGIRLRYES